MTVETFDGPHRFLSNFFPAEVWMGGVVYPTVEHAFQAAKTLDALQRYSIRIAATPGLAKHLGRKASLREDWKDIKLEVMEDLVRQKFTEPGLRWLLLATIRQELQEGNDWEDTFWGVCRGQGKNHLGKILMRVRDEIAGVGDEP